MDTALLNENTFPEYGKLTECWVGRAYGSEHVEDQFIKDILDETEEDLANFSNMLGSLNIQVRRPVYSDFDVTKKPQLLHARDHLLRLGNKLYVGPRYESNITDWLCLLDGRLPYVAIDNLCAPSVIRADKVYFDAVSWTRERYEYFKYGNLSIDCVFERM